MATVLVPVLLQTVVTNFASTASVTRTITVTNAGDTLICTVFNRGATSGYAASAVAGCGATWYLVGSIVNNNAGPGAIDIWVGINASAGAGTVTCTMNGTNNSGCNLDEWKNLDNSVLINQSALFASGTGNGTNASVEPPDLSNPQIATEPNSLTYGALSAASPASVASGPFGQYTGLTGPTNGGSQENPLQYALGNVKGGGFTVGWLLTGAAQWSELVVILRAQQPSGGAVFNDSSLGVNAAVLETQAGREYMDDVFDGLAAGGTGVLAGCSVSSYGAAFPLDCVVGPGTALLNWAPVTLTTQQEFTPPTASSTNPRRDLLYTDGTGTVSYLAGVAAATPCIPVPTKFPFIPLAVIEVPANATVLDPPGQPIGPPYLNAQITDKRVLLNLPPSGRDAYLTTGGFETMTRFDATVATISGAPTGAEGGMAIFLPAGFTVGHIAFVSGTTAASVPTHWWFCLRDLKGNLLAVTADQLTTAWAASTQKSLAVATTAEGSATAFTTRYSGLYYISRTMAATTPTTFQGTAVSVVISDTLLPKLACQMGALGSQVAPPSFPNLAAPGASIGGTLYGSVLN